MKKKYIKIQQIPAVLWGDPSKNLVITVHGNMSNKEDTVIALFAEQAVRKGYQLLSFDLPEHGERQGKTTLCTVQVCVEELDVIMQYAKSISRNISLYANSIGAYFALLAYQNENIEKAWLLSPVVNMQLIIENMMSWFDISPEQLKIEQSIKTPIKQTLYWDYYCYVKKHPITKWNVPTYVLYANNDEMCERKTILEFVENFSVELEIVDDAEHHFHTPAQLETLKIWLEKKLHYSTK